MAGQQMTERDPLLTCADECCDFAKQAFANGDEATGIAAVTFAAQLVQLAKARAIIRRAEEEPRK